MAQVTIPKKIYYLKANGQFILDTGQSTGSNLIPTTIEQDFRIYEELTKYTFEEVGCLQLEVDEYAEDFEKSISFRVNTETRTIEFTFQTEPIENEEIPEIPYEQQIALLNNRIVELEQTISQLTQNNLET